MYHTWLVHVVEQEVHSSTLNWTNFQGLNIGAENVLSLLWHQKMFRHSCLFWIRTMNGRPHPLYLLSAG